MTWTTSEMSRQFCNVIRTENMDELEVDRLVCVCACVTDPSVRRFDSVQDNQVACVHRSTTYRRSTTRDFPTKGVVKADVAVAARAKRRKVGVIMMMNDLQCGLCEAILLAERVQ